MKTPASPHFTTVDLHGHFNSKWREQGPGYLQRAGSISTLYGPQTLQGIPFLFGPEDGNDALVLRPGGIDATIGLPATLATYLIFVHAVEDTCPSTPKGFRQIDSGTSVVMRGLGLGGLVSTYSLKYGDGSREDLPVRRRIGIQQPTVSWRASPFAAVPARGPSVHSSHGENAALGRAPSLPYAYGEGRALPGLVGWSDNLWLYALPNPHPEKAISALILRAGSETSRIFALSTTQLADHPLRIPTRRKLRMRLPDGVKFNSLGELDTDERGDQIGIDLGTVISARAVLDYSQSNWVSGVHEVQPVRAEREVLVEYAAHPAARLYLRSQDGCLHVRELRSMSGSIPATRPVKVVITDKGTGQRIAARLHVHGAHGEYLPPKGHHRKINAGLHEDYAAELLNGLNQYAYVDGSCVIDVPFGEVHFEISRGFEVRPLRRTIEIDSNTDVISLEAEKVLHWRERGWVSADTHVHFLSPHTALLEGKAEDVNVVNLLASQWGEAFSNVGDFDGRTTLGAKDFGGDGEFLVRVGTENRMQVLGHISLLGYEGEMIVPLCTGGPEESAIGDGLEVSMTGWAQSCREQGGLVVLPHGPDRQAERGANIVLGLADALELVTTNPRRYQISPFGLADWYRYLNIGYRLPLVAGSDKESATMILGGARTYVQISGEEFTYRNWMAAVRRGDTFITIGPLVDMSVEGRRPGARINLPVRGGTVAAQWRVESVSIVPERVEVIRNGVVVHEVSCDRLSSEGQVSLQVTESCWLAVRVRGSVAGRQGDIAAHTSAVYIDVGDRKIFAVTDAMAVLAEIEGSIAYLDTVAPRSDEARQARIRANLELAHHRLHHRLHEVGASHAHAPIHSVHIEREH